MIGVRRTVGACVAVAALTLSACAGEEAGGNEAAGTAEEGAETPEEAGNELDELVEAATEEGSVVIYATPAEPVLAAVAEGFEEEYGIPVEFIRLVGNDLTTRLSSEADTDSVYADVFISGNPAFMTDAIESGWVRNPLEEIPGLADEWPSDFIDEELNSAVLQVDLMAVGYHTDHVEESELPASWADLADDRWDGQILAAEASAGETMLMNYYMLYREYGEDFLRDYASNIAQGFPSMVPMTESLNAGEGHLAAPVGAILPWNANASGAPVDTLIFDDYIWGAEASVGLTEGSPNPNAGALLAHYMYFGGGHDILTEPFGTTSPVSEDFPSGYERADFDGARENRDLILELMGE